MDNVTSVTGYTKQQILYEFWNIYDKNGIKDALLFLENNNYTDDYYDNYKNEITTTNALNSMLSNLNLL
jgi:hypothetical protein